jgi:N-acylneuraminate cytidylyltransferase
MRPAEGGGVSVEAEGRLADPSVVAFVPARSGSKRVADKNIRLLDGHPLVAYSIVAARQSGVFDAVILATDSELYAEIGRHYGAETPFLRPAGISGEKSPDIEWIEFALDKCREAGRDFDCFAILRPTSPFRKPQTIRRAWDRFRSAEGIDSLRAIEKADQHPGKMWVVRGDRMLPLLPVSPEDLPWHSQQYAALPTVHVQNESLELAWSRVVRDGRSIAGTVLLPFFTEGDEGVDINREHDWWHARFLMERGEAKLPEIDRPAFDAARLPPHLRESLGAR